MKGGLGVARVIAILNLELVEAHRDHNMEQSKGGQMEELRWGTFQAEHG
jgi:hypothetical protein